MRKFLVAAAIATALPGLAAAELISKPSPYDVATTIDRLAKAVEAAGATVFARVDHAGGAMKIDEDLRPTLMLMFGNPRLGTPALQAAQTAGLDLPLRALAYEDANGQVQLVYHPPSELTEFGVPADAEVLKKMSNALDNLTNAAVAE